MPQQKQEKKVQRRRKKDDNQKQQIIFLKALTEEPDTDDEDIKINETTNQNLQYFMDEYIRAVNWLQEQRNIVVEPNKD